MANHHTRTVPQLSAGERAELEQWVRRPKTSQALALRARIVLAGAAGESDIAVAERLGTTRVTVGKWRRRFVAARATACLTRRGPGLRARSATRTWSVW